MNKRLMYCCMIGVSTLCILSLFVANAYAWGNGTSGDGFGTHDWVLKEAIDDLDGCGSWIVLNTALLATDDPDTVFHDTYYHCYDIWGTTYGNAPYKIQYYYDQAVTYLKAGNYASASKSLGWMAHYVADICNPMHTDSSTKETSSVHSGYESKVNTYTDVKDEAHYNVADEGETDISSATSFSKTLATWSHGYYTSLVNEYSANGWTTKCDSWTQLFLNKAGNALQDLIYSMCVDSGKY